jgi:hypothetical protein
MVDAKREQPDRCCLVSKKRQTLATKGSRNRQRPCPKVHGYGQEAVFIGVRARIALTDMKTAVKLSGLVSSSIFI